MRKNVIVTIVLVISIITIMLLANAIKYNDKNIPSEELANRNLEDKAVLYAAYEKGYTTEEYIIEIVEENENYIIDIKNKNNGTQVDTFTLKRDTLKKWKIENAKNSNDNTKKMKIVKGSKTVKAKK